MINKIANWKSIGVFGLLFLLFMLYLFPKYHSKMGEYAGYDILALDERFFYSKNLVDKTLNDLGEKGRIVNVFLLQTVDMVYPMVYGILLSLVIVRLSNSGSNHIIKILGFAPFVACLLDYFENFGLLKLLRVFPEISTDQVIRVSAITSAKWFFILITVLTIAFLVVRNMWSWYTSRK